MPIYYIPTLDIIVLMVGSDLGEGSLTINVHADPSYKEEIEKLNYNDMVHIGEL